MRKKITKKKKKKSRDRKRERCVEKRQRVCWKEAKNGKENKKKVHTLEDIV